MNINEQIMKEFKRTKDQVIEARENGAKFSDLMETPGLMEIEELATFFWFNGLEIEFYPNGNETTMRVIRKDGGRAAFDFDADTGEMK